MAAQNYRQPQRQSPLKIVFRQGKKFICGMCRKAYASQKDAKSCLRDDIERLVEVQPVQVVRRGEEYAFRCSLCARDYETQHQALACMRDCKYHLDKKRILEEHITGIPLKPPDPKKFAKKEIIAVPVQQVPKVSLKRKEPPIQAAPEVPPEETQAPVEIEEFTGAEASEPTSEPTIDPIEGDSKE